MQGSSEVLGALNTVYHALISAEGQAHLQEHAFEYPGWSSSKYWDAIENELHKECTHWILNRMFELEGSPTYELGFPVVYYADGFSLAINETIQSLGKCRDAYQNLCEVADIDGDYVTQKICWCHLKFIEKHITIFEGLLIRFNKLGSVVMGGIA